MTALKRSPPVHDCEGSVSLNILSMHRQFLAADLSQIWTSQFSEVYAAGATAVASIIWWRVRRGVPLCVRVCVRHRSSSLGESAVYATRCMQPEWIKSVVSCRLLSALSMRCEKVENCFLKFSRCCSCITFCQHRHEQPSARSRRCDVWKIIFGQQWRRLAWTICWYSMFIRTWLTVWT